MFRKYSAQSEVDLTADFGRHLLANPQSAASINSFMTRLALLVVQNRISPRRAAVVAYLSNLLLLRLAEIDRENDTGRFPSKPALAAVHPAVSASDKVASDTTTQKSC
jgi:hypothetical protein